MRTVKNCVTSGNSPAPTPAEIHGDSHIRTFSGYERAIAVQDEAEARFAALACDSDTSREFDEQFARASLMNLYRTHGRSIFNKVVHSVEMQIVDDVSAETRRVTEAFFAAAFA